MTTSEAVDYLTDIVIRQADVIDEMYILLTKYVSVDELTEIGIVDRIRQAGFTRKDYVPAEMEREVDGEV